MTKLPVETLDPDHWEKMKETREWLIEQGRKPDDLWPDWYPPGTAPPWYQRWLDNKT